MSFNYYVAIILSFIVLGFSTITLGQLVLFLSSHSPLQLGHYSLFTNIGQNGSVLSRSVVDFVLLALFGVQHSLQNQKIVKKFLLDHGWGVVERLLYNLGACCALQALMNLWLPIPNWVVWEISTSNRPLLWWMFSLVHSVSYLVIYSGCCVMDPLELLGVKQVIHSIQGRPDPLSLKSEGLNRFYSHMRHPSFSALSLVLLVHPVMQADRLLLACAFLAYTILRARVDDADYAYQKRLLLRKERDLNSFE